MVRSEEHHSRRRHSRAVGESAPKKRRCGQKSAPITAQARLNCRTFEWWQTTATDDTGNKKRKKKKEKESDREQIPLFCVKLWSKDLLELVRGGRRQLSSNEATSEIVLLLLACFPPKCLHSERDATAEADVTTDTVCAGQPFEFKTLPV